MHADRAHPSPGKDTDVTKRICGSPAAVREMCSMRRIYLATWIFLALSGVLVVTRGIAPPPRWPWPSDSHPPAASMTPKNGAGQWFAAIRPHCNAVEVQTRHRWSPAPEGAAGAGFSAACFALAGRIDLARSIIDELDGDDRRRAAAIVFDVGHPVADAGDDRSAGPLMALVVEYWPNHHMALYHAGMARLGLGETAAAQDYLHRFLEHYGPDDGWTRAARSALAELTP